MKITTYKELIVWQKAMELVKEIYKLTAKYPDDERFGLKSQMERAVVSIPSQIAKDICEITEKNITNLLQLH